MSLLRGTKIYSIFTGTCPVCHRGKMYTSRQLYNVSTTLKMNENCINCNTKFKIEPSFFYGAMYVSYGVGIVFALIAFIISYFIIGLGKFYSFLVIIGTLILFLPVILRLSRNIWINLFLKFDTKYK